MHRGDRVLAMLACDPEAELAQDEHGEVERFFGHLLEPAESGSRARDAEATRSTTIHFPVPLHQQLRSGSGFAEATPVASAVRRTLISGSRGNE